MREFPHAMLREIYEQPDAIRRTVEMYADADKLKTDPWAAVPAWSTSGPGAAGEILIAASGSSRHSGLAAEIMLEDLCGLAVDVEYASEYSSRGPGPAGMAGNRNPPLIVVSQSGETSDTLAALREASSRGQQTLAITNSAESSMARDATVSLPLGAGRELAIPATKSFTCQLAVLYLLTLQQAFQLGTMNHGAVSARLAELHQLPGSIEAQLTAWESAAATLAYKYCSASTFLYLGRGVHYPMAREGALKLKEASYVHAEGYPSGELKHGPNALVSDRVPVVILATVDGGLDSSILRYEKTVQLLTDLRAQGAIVLAVANTGDERVAGLASETIFVEPASEHLLPILEIVPLQLFAYFMALEHGIDVDRPRNLAKAVIET